jgi:hypothetical protein
MRIAFVDSAGFLASRHSPTIPLADGARHSPRARSRPGRRFLNRVTLTGERGTAPCLPPPGETDQYRARYLALWRSGGRYPRHQTISGHHPWETAEAKIPHRCRSCALHGVPNLGGSWTRLIGSKPLSPRFAAMRKLAMKFRAILFGADPAGLHHILRAQLIPIEGLSVH